ncbi:hypothetical protein STEG23_005744 [Scotinomys teguina]
MKFADKWMDLENVILSENIGKKMTCQEFITNLQGVSEGVDFSKDLLKTSSCDIFEAEYALKQKELEKGEDFCDAESLRIDAAGLRNVWCQFQKE